MIKITPNTRIFVLKNNTKECSIVFEIGKCETCGGEIVEKSFTGSLAKNIKELLSAGAKEINYLPSAFLWNDSTQKYDCKNCRKSSSTPEIPKN